MTTTDFIVARMSAVGWTQADLARATNIPRQNLWSILHGKRPLLAQHLFVIDSALGLGLDYGQCEWEDEGHVEPRGAAPGRPTAQSDHGS